jgi:hypothetical protein
MDSLRSTVERALGNQYEVLNLIGRGGMGAVYLARERFLQRLVAVKVLPHDTASDRDGRERFLREARTAAGLSHPSIVPLHTFAEAEGTLLYVMGYVAGESLESRLSREGRLAPDQATRMMTEIADALAYAHSMGVVHRDVKPDNILIDGQTGRAFLTDFGIAKQETQQSLTRTGMVVGTPHYMSPEQGSGDPDVDGRSDLYALGVIGYRMVSGRLPFDAPGFQELLMQHATREPAPLSRDAATSQLAGVIERCLRKQPAERWQSGAAIVEALRPRDEYNIALADELTGLPSSGVALLLVLGLTEVVLGLLHAFDPGAMEFRAAALIPWVTVPVLTGTYWLKSRRRGQSYREIMRMAFWAPPWWTGWWPRSLRRPGDVWDRLPNAVRKVRAVISAMAVGGLAIQLPLLILSATWWGMGRVSQALALNRIVIPLTAMTFVVLMPTLGTTIRWSKRFGISSLLASRLVREPTWNNPFWKRAEVAGLLRNVEGMKGRLVAGTPQSPAELVAAIDRAAMALPEPLRAAGKEAAVAAHDVLRFVDDVDREMAALSREADPADRAQLERKLASFPTSGGGESPRSQMRDLVEQQLQLIVQLEARRRQLVDERDRSVGMLRTLWLQIASSRTRFASDEGSVAELSGQIRAICADLERGQSAMGEVDRLLEPTITGPR